MSEEDSFEVALYEYIQTIRKVRRKFIKKYGKRADKWFGIK